MSANSGLLVVLVVRCFVRGPQGLLLILKRSKSAIHHPGLWEVPGGQVGEGQDIWEALDREVREETNLRVRSEDRVVVVESRLIKDGEYANKPYVALFGVADVVAGRLELSREHEEAEWVTYEEMFSFDLTPETERAARALESRLA